MIYEVSTSDLSVAIQNGSTILIISADSTRALIKSDTPELLNIINEYPESEFISLTSQDFWKQPCVDCGV